MNVLVVGTGVIGTTYGWQLSLAGHAVTHWVRDEAKRARLERDGLPINCLDLRRSRRRPLETDVLYRPPAVDIAGAARGDWDLVIVSVKSHQLAELLPALRDRIGHGTLLFLQNLRLGEDALITASLDPERFAIGYPFKGGGGSDARGGVETVIFGGRLTHTMLGRPDGRITPALRAIARALVGAGMAPRLTRRIVPYVRTHYVWAAASVGAFLKAGTYERFLTPQIQREAYCAMREGWEICRAQGIEPRRVSPTRYFYLPLWMLVPFTQWTYANDGMRRMFEGHVQHAPDEMRVMFDDVLGLGEQYGIEMPTMRGFERFVAEYEASRRVVA